MNEGVRIPRETVTMPDNHREDSLREVLANVEKQIKNGSPAQQPAQYTPPTVRVPEQHKQAPQEAQDAFRNLVDFGEAAAMYYEKVGKEVLNKAEAYYNLCIQRADDIRKQTKEHAVEGLRMSEAIDKMCFDLQEHQKVV